MKQVYCAESLIDGQLIVHLLEENGIPVLLFNQNAQGAIGELPVVGPEVWIKRDMDYPRAIKTINQHLSATKHMSANIICLNCNEGSPATFEICWQCNRPLPVVE